MRTLAQLLHGSQKPHYGASKAKREHPVSILARYWLSRATAYRLCNEPSYIPTGEVIAKICRAYNWQPGDFIIYEPDN